MYCLRLLPCACVMLVKELPAADKEMIKLALTTHAEVRCGSSRALM